MTWPRRILFSPYPRNADRVDRRLSLGNVRDEAKKGETLLKKYGAGDYYWDLGDGRVQGTVESVSTLGR